jgi:PAS domain S-box-containing protein
LALALPASLSAAGGKNIKFQHIAREQGLSQAFVTSILQDREGFMWFGTQEGLNRYDGYRFTTFTHRTDDPGSLSHDTVKTLLEDRRGVLWVGTDGGGLSRFNPADSSFTHFRHDPDDPGSLSNDRVRALLEDHSGRLWVGTDGGGLSRLDRLAEGDGAAAGAGSFVRYEHDPANPAGISHNRIRGLFEDRLGLLWIATDGGGLDMLDPRTGLFTHYRHDPEDPRSLSSDRVRVVYGDRDGAVWAGTYENGLNRLDRRSERVAGDRVAGDRVAGDRVAGDGSASGTFTRFQHDPGDPTSLGADQIWAIYQDREGTLWIGTGGGLNEWRPQSGDFARYRHDPADPFSLSHDRVSSVLQDRGGVLWVGTYLGLNKWNTAFGSFLHYPPQPDDPQQLSASFVTSFAESPEGELWVGTYGGGLNLLTADGTFRHFRHDPADPRSLGEDRIMSLHVDRRGELWIGTFDSGLNRLERRGDGSATGTFTRYQHDPDDPHSLSWKGVTSILEDHRGALWVGTYRGGLNRFDRGPPTRDTGEFVRYRHDPADPGSLSNDLVIKLYEDRSGTLWIGTEGGGLNRLDDPESGRFTAFRHDPDDPHSLSSDHAWMIHEDRRGDLWIGTDGGGLNRWTAADREAGRAVFRRYTKDDGLPSDIIFGVLSDDEGHLWLSSNRGLTRFDPRTETFKNFDASHGLQNDEFIHGAMLRAAGGEMYFGGINGFNAFDPRRVRENGHVPPVVLTEVLKFNDPVDFGRPLTEVRDITLGYRDYVVAFEFAALDFTASEKNHYRHQLEGFDRQWVDSGTLRRATYTNLEPGSYRFRVRASNNDGVWNDAGLELAIRVLPPPWKTWWAYGLYSLAAGCAALLFTRAQGKKRQRAAELARTNAVLQEEIGQRRAKEEALQREKEKAQTYLDVAGVIMVVVDAEGRVSLINQKGCQVLGYREEEIVGRDWVERFVPESQRRKVRALLDSGAPQGAYESSVLNRAGEERIIEWHTTLLPGSGGTLSSGTDLTQERRLKQAKESAETASRAKSQFLANMSHEIRTPMNGVLGMVELLLDGELTPRQREFADIARRSARNLLDLLNDILDFSKIEAGKLELEVVDFDLRELIDDVAQLFAEASHEKNLELLCVVDDAVPGSLRGDPTRLRQILSNLVSNAIKFTDEGEVALRVSVDAVDERSAGLRFEVRDTGMGLEPEAQKRIFEAFQQADGSTTRKYGGTGLGLSISTELVAMMGGEMGAESAPGEGSTFWFTLRLDRQPDHSGTVRFPYFGPQVPRVLVVDDNATSRESLVRQLEIWGASASGAPDGPRAVQRLLAAGLGATPYHVVLVDHQMPGMDGLALAQTITAAPGLKDLAVVLLTPVAPPSEGKLRRAGIVRCLSKPVRQAELYDCVAALMTPGARFPEAPPAETGARRTLAGRRILLVEDNPINQDVVRCMLDNLNAGVEVANRGTEALEMVAQRRYDLILMDCQMPVMDGYETTRNIRRRERSAAGDSEPARIPIVAMTANAMKGDRERCLAAGMDDYLAKPFRPAQLYDCLERWLPAKQGAGDRHGVRSGAAADGPSPLDPSALEQLRAIEEGGAQGLLDRTLREYIDSSPGLIATLRRAVAAGDAETMRDAAHSLKSMSAHLGAVQVALLAKSLEAMARQNDTGKAEEVLSALEPELDRVKLVLEKECQETVN